MAGLQHEDNRNLPDTWTEHPEVDSFVFADAYDVIVLSDPTESSYVSWSRNEWENKMVFSGEKNCWPVKALESNIVYLAVESRWKYLNSGLYYAPRDKFMAIIEDDMPEYIDDDQLYFQLKHIYDSTGIMNMNYDTVIDND